MSAAAAGAAPLGWRVWLIAIRPKTLPAAIAPILVGSAVAFRENGFDLLTASAALAVALLLQIVANLANDLFDFRRGADVDRVGPTRVTQSGLITPEQMTRAIGVAICLAIVCGLYLVWVGGWPILLLGLLAILAAVGYTAGPYPLGYHGLGDLCVFLFFGVAGVAGSAYVQTLQVTRLSLLASVPIGLLATAIIVVNNLRDIETDRAAGKRTLAVRLGSAWTVREYGALLVASYVVPPLLWLLGDLGWGWLLPWLSVPWAVMLWLGISHARGRALNPILGGTARLTLLFGALFALGIAL